VTAAEVRDELVGASVPRVEDARLLSGRGRYVDDLRLPGMLHAAFVRSPYPHARVVAVSVEQARTLAGVEAVITGADVAAATAPLRIPDDIPNYARPTFHALATDKVRHVGDPVAIVVASSRAVAEDAAELVEVAYEPLAAVPSAESGLGPSSAPLFDDVGSNVLYRDRFAHGDVDAAFAAADRLVRATFVQQRVANVPMEGRGVVADFDPLAGELTVFASTQSPHAIRFLLSLALGHPVSRIRVVAPNVGGGFGQKIPTHREEIAVATASKLLAKPIKWVEDRLENLVAAGHAREETVEAELALRQDGTILGLRARITLDHGAYPVLPIPAPAYTNAIRVMLPGGYRVPAVAVEATIVATNKASYVPYRGPWAVECLVREALLDVAAHELGIDRLDLRRRNLITEAEQPVRLVTGPTIERVSALRTLERAAEPVADEPTAGDGGMLRGVGFAVLVSPEPGPPDYNTAVGFGETPEPARARLEPDGRLTLVTAQAPHGQGHETTLAQLAAQTLGVRLDDVRVVHGDTRVTPFHLLGTASSRAASMASGAVVLAVGRLREKVLRLAGDELGAAPDELEIVDGDIRVAGDSERATTLAAVAASAYFGPGVRAAESEPGLQAAADFAQPQGGWSVATHACVVEIDGDTGQVRIPRYVVVQDCGRMVNPAIVDGQIRGGVVQGIGAALLEHAAYDAEGQFLAGTFMDYLLPTASDVPPIEVEHLPPEGADDADFRGVGQGGAVAAPAAVVNAVADALGATVTELPLTPPRILALLDRASG
jgi:aerobic carbon-monoxide dehydrogenase large subunit